MKICAYVQRKYAKQTYKNECFDTRQFVGLRVIIDSLERAGYTVDWAGIDTVHRYDVVLVSITSDCDWWEYIKERICWQSGDYKVIAGGAGVLHVTPFLSFADYFSLGRGEHSVANLVNGLAGKSADADNSIIESATFSPDNLYYIRQTDAPYPHELELSSMRKYKEGAIGCNHKCLFCGYTWHRKFKSDKEFYQMGEGLFSGMEDKERALIDMKKDYSAIDFSKLRTTAIDGCSERLRKMVNKPITRNDLTGFYRALIDSTNKKGVKPHQIKLFNIVGYPTEGGADYAEVLETIKEADREPANGRQWSIVLHNTPFRPMAATPLACAPTTYMDFRQHLPRLLRDRTYKGNIIYQGKRMWAVASMGTDSLSTVFLSMIAHRGLEADTENISRLCATPKFWTASSQVKLKTLEKYFDAAFLFGEFTAETLPSRYLRTYAKVEKCWK
jgi:hypothetical protein